MASMQSSSRQPSHMNDSSFHQELQSQRGNSRKQNTVSQAASRQVSQVSKGGEEIELESRKKSELKESNSRRNTSINQSDIHFNSDKVGPDIRKNTPEQPSNPRKNTEVRQFYSHKNTDVKQHSSHQNSTLKESKSRQNTEVKQSSSRQNTDVKPPSSRQNREARQQSSRQNTEVKPSNSRQTLEAKSPSSRQNTEVKPPSSRQNTEVKPPSSRQNTEVKPPSSRQNTEVKQPSSRQNTDVKKPGSRQNTDLKQPSSLQSTEAKNPSNIKMTRKDEANTRIDLQNTRAETHLNTRDNDKIVTSNEDRISPMATEVGTQFRLTSPSKTAFSQAHTREGSRQNTQYAQEGRSSKTKDKDDHAPPLTPVVPLINLTSSTGSSDLNLDESVSLQEFARKELGETQCQFCEMTFTSNILLEYHKSKFCIGMPPVTDFRILSEDRDFFTVGKSSVIHSTPRGWSVAGKSPQKLLRNYTIEDLKKFSKLHWDKCFNGRVPEFAVKAGYDETSRCDIYVCRAKVNKELIPGKVVPSDNCAYVSSAGQEVEVTDYEVLTDPHELLSWKQTDIQGGIPKGAQKGGFDSNDMLYFIGRATAPDGSLCCGRYVPQERMFFFPWGGREHSAVKFEFLCKK